MSALQTLRKVRRATYRAGAVLGDVNAVGTAWERRSAAPVAKRVIRKAVWRHAGALLRKVLP